MNSSGDSLYTSYTWVLHHNNKELMTWFRFLAINDDRMAIGDTQTWLLLDGNDEMIGHEITLTGTAAGSVSLTASAALLLASATLL